MSIYLWYFLLNIFSIFFLKNSTLSSRLRRLLKSVSTKRMSGAFEIRRSLSDRISLFRLAEMRLEIETVETSCRWMQYTNTKKIDQIFASRPLSIEIYIFIVTTISMPSAFVRKTQVTRPQ